MADRLRVPFIAHKYTGRAIVLLASALVFPLALALAKRLSFTLKFFYMMGKGLSGKLSYTGTGLVRS